ncbi:MAG: Rpn family recombination-promoting nuclease/putative transposase, partial [Sarcina sp.]
VFKIAKRLLSTNANDNEIFLSKVELFNELVNYNKVKTMDQRKALTYFLEYLFLIQNDDLSEKFKEFKDNVGGVRKMTIDEIREKYLKEEGREEGKVEGREEGREEGIKLTKKVLKLFSNGETVENIAKICNVSEDIVKEIIE